MSERNQTFVICPEIAAGAGGLADYTLRVLDHWPDQCAVQLIVPNDGGAITGLAGWVHEIERDSGALLALLPLSGGKVLLQYSAYGFDRYGYPRWLLRALVEWKKRSGGLLVVMFHEIWTFWPVLNKNYFVQQLHRRDLRTLLAQTDAAFTSTASQAQHLHALAPGAVPQVLPVGSNVRATSTLPHDHEREVGVAVLFGLLATRLRTLEAMRTELEGLSTAGVIVKIISVGAGDSPDQLERERALLTRFELRAGFEQRGALPEPAVSEILSHAQFGISAQDELSITKSGTLMAYAAHEMNIVSTHAGPAKPEPLCWFTSPAELLDGIASGELATRAKRLRDWQEGTAAWPFIAERFADALQLAHAVS